MLTFEGTPGRRPAVIISLHYMHLLNCKKGREEVETLSTDRY